MLRKLFTAAVLASAILGAGQSAAHALPFNDDMVGGQLLIPGRVMRQESPDSIAVGSLPRQVDKQTPYQGTNPRPGDSASAIRGERLFQINCKVCHGVIQNGVHTPSDLQQYGLPSINLLISQGPGKDDGYIFKYIFHGQDAIMPAYGYKLSNDEIWDLVNYVRKLQADNPL